MVISEAVKLTPIAKPFLQDDKPNRNSHEHDRLIQSQEDVTCHSTYGEKEYGGDIFNLWQNEDDLFVQTRASNAVEEMLNVQNLVIVAGHYGSGKTAIVQHIALKYRKRDWTVKPVNAVAEIQLTYMSRYFSRKNILFVLNDPIGKESFDEALYSSWKNCEEALQCFETNVKVLITCRKSLLENAKIQGIFKTRWNVIIIDDNEYRLNTDEKRQMLKINNPNQAFSEKDMIEILKIETFFPLLCKLSANDAKFSKGISAFFRNLDEVLQKEIRNLSFSNKEAYCGLVCLVLLNDKLSSQDLVEHDKQFKECLNRCNLSNFTSPETIIGNLELYKDFLIRKVDDAYHFYNVFVMEATVVVFGTDYPEYVIAYADIHALQRRVRFEDCADLTDSFTITLSDNYIGNVADRFIQEMFGNRFMEVVLHPCLRMAKVVHALIKKVEEDRSKLALMVKQIKTERFIQEPWNVMNEKWLSRVTFVTRDSENISPLFALIAFCHDELSSFFLKELKKATKTFSDIDLLFAVCCNGSKNLFSMFSEKEINNCAKRKWGSLNLMDIVCLFHNHELLQDLLPLDVYRKLENNKDSIMKSLELAFECNFDDNIHNDRQQVQSSRCKTIELLLKNGCEVNGFAKNGETPLCMAVKHVDDSTVRLLLDHGAEVNLCNSHGDSPLYIACGNGHVSNVELLLENGATVTVCNYNGVSPLYQACNNGYDNVVKLLLQCDVEIDLCNQLGNTPLSVACENGHDRTVELLLNHGADINLYNINKVSPLFKACANGHARTVELLLQRGADLNLCDQYGNSPFSVAIENGHSKIVELLRDQGTHINPDNVNKVYALFKACENGLAKIVQGLLQKGVDLKLCDEYGCNPLSIACENGHQDVVEIFVCLHNSGDINLDNEQKAFLLSKSCELGHKKTVQCLLNNGINLDVYDDREKTLLYKACENGHDSIVQVLLNYGADVNLSNENGNSPLSIACEKARESIVKLLLQNKADVNSCDTNKDSPLLRACEYGYDSIVQYLLSSGAVVNFSNNENETPLFKACENGKDSIVELLLKTGADVSLCDTIGASPLSIACEKGHTSIAHLLLNNGANVNLCDEKKNSPLNIACNNKHYSTVSVLIVKGADVNLCNTDKISPLYTACVKGCCNIVHLLLESGAKVNVCDINGVTPLHVACEYKHYDTVNVLLENGADVNICDKNGIKAIDIAREKGQFNIIELLENNTVEYK
uniref:Ankyrin repeat and KH domain-containing protein mask-like isoform X2 n=1 Tax=Crassostrea virginica TaxID=6565 RepID=A0A8B8AHD5_CRAVI|nr:ankyrin repeat and KH domain-containing protein mask-like isoform X2 [Crassostrea virginica]